MLRGRRLRDRRRETLGNLFSFPPVIVNITLETDPGRGLGYDFFIRQTPEGIIKWH